MILFPEVLLGHIHGLEARYPKPRHLQHGLVNTQNLSEALSSPRQIRSTLPYIPNVGIILGDTRIDYEISFTSDFYLPLKLHSLYEIGGVRRC